MSETPVSWADRLVRSTTTVSVVVLAVIAAIISYKHMFALVHRYGERSWTAALLPISVDGMIAASSMSLLASSRQGQRSGLLPWVLLVIGSAASLLANVAVAEPSAVGRLIAAWPSCALIGSYELLMRQIRQASVPNAAREAIGSYETQTAATSNGAGSYETSDEAHMRSLAEEAVSYEAPTAPVSGSGNSYEAQTERTAHPVGERGRNAFGRGFAGPDFVGMPPRRSASGLQRQAWQWAQANRTPAGDLPSGRAIADAFERCERWGRLVKQAGRAGRLSPVATSQ